MLMADDWSQVLAVGDPSTGDDDVNLSIDIQSLWEILEESPGRDPSQNNPEDLSIKKEQGLAELQSASISGAELAGSVTFSPSQNSESSDSRAGPSDGSFESARNSVMSDYGKQEHSAQISSPASCSGSLADWMLPISSHGSLSAGSNGVMQDIQSYGRDYHEEIPYEIPNRGATFSFPAGDDYYGSDFREVLNSNHSEGEAEFQFKLLERDTQYGPVTSVLEKSDLNHGRHCDSSENSLKGSGTSETMETPVMEYDGTLPWVLDDSFNLQYMSNNNVMTMYTKDQLDEVLPTQIEGICSAAMREAQVKTSCGADLEASMTGDPNFNGLNIKCAGYDITTLTKENSLNEIDHRPIVNHPSSRLSPLTVSSTPSNKPLFHLKDERNIGLVSAQGMAYSSYDASDDTCHRTSLSIGYEYPVRKGLEQLLPPILPSISSKKLLVHKKEENQDLLLLSKRAHHTLANIDETVLRNPVVADDHCLEVRASKQRCVQQLQPCTAMKQQFDCRSVGIDSTLVQPKGMDTNLAKVSCQTVQSNIMVNSYHYDDDPDVCILEDISEPARSNVCSMKKSSFITSHHSTFSDPLTYMGMGGVKLKANDERLIFRVVLQDLSQPKTEATPPDGVLSVPLLRHQRIALSWMVQKETASPHCSGGILADDQGLGKTISTIALILKERAPPSRVCLENLKQCKMETLNLDDDDDDCVSDPDGSKEEAKSCQVLPIGFPMTSKNTSVQGKGRPAAGTLVVCPTSVLRQWDEELHNKVNSIANLSVLVYHGSNRTKDPWELAKYDVVLTTYSIVSMEVPKQPLVDKDDDETRRLEADGVPSVELSSSKKRKYPDKRSAKDKKGIDNISLESTARPLARVGWFRVVLDEAQSIKNHRTQVARACWGLRAKRRWCLSGTPIQNAVDDLYSYFRFLRYDPYAVYKSFCSTIKVPINRNPTNGYKKLQAVLKTIMLRRTKGTLLDGEPIINLPPKSVELKKVDFTKEEREFYCRLEADSRAQFAEYAAAGTVKQNYVNILLMLLRLRQACDHPLLVRGYGSRSASSVEMAKKLPREMQVRLLNCLEASLAICGICNDPPEDAVVTSCGHVFCHQCICEHLTGDDNQCPITNCKARLCVSSVFSRATLKCSLSEQYSQNDTLDCTGSEVSEELVPGCWSHSFDSSKIKAALQVLQSLSKPNNCTLQTGSSKANDAGITDLRNSSDTLSRGVEPDMLDKRDSDLVKSANEFTKVEGEKAIVFSQWTGMLDLLETCLKNSSIQYRRLDGTMSVAARDKAVKDFKTLPEVSVMIMSLKAASLGLNMVAACHVLLLDLWWNPTTEDQAVDRAHRIGQTRPVTVLRLTVKDTVEDRILALQQKKREMVASAFGEDETGSRQTRLTVEDLKYLFMAD
ncbi:helicase-like transcription factor CHR28 isoform X2 [Diospyros lotus]|uniref:helicase-like transcription factor CHR28 isoform X2 n=1 Tax=Diospyros lotus TaxID=55363 RepID=UPI00225A3675|nr:helicase-like transcription factor CHR28 isoform X2 [Diospyros lotus]